MKIKHGDHEIDLDAHHEEAWRRLPVDIRQRAVGRLQYAYDPSFFDDVQRLANEAGLGNWLPPFWHHGQGMHVRNILRSDVALREMVPLLKIGSPHFPPAIKDSELPDLADLYGPESFGQECRNWDDYYIQCVEAAAGLRAI